MQSDAANTKPGIIIIDPNPARLIEGLRDTGYQLNTAIADIIDNSIAAEASNIHVELNLTPANKVVLRIWDDGCGMDQDGLLKAMQYGAPARVSKASLGKFGLGLKTASTAFSKVLTVVSRLSADAPVAFSRWDVDHVINEGKWELQVGTPNPQLQTLFESKLKGKKGTLVCWDNVDRVLKSDLRSLDARKAVDKLEASLRRHLAMTFQRYLDRSDGRARTVNLQLNNIPVIYWDPFCVGRSELVKEETVDVDTAAGKTASFTVRAFILPRKEEFVSPDGSWDEDAWRTAELKNANQGIYIYRQERLIHGPDWLSLGAKEPHFTLLRVEFSFDHQLDDAFQVDIKKSQIILNESITNYLTEFLTPIRREADDRYRKGQRKAISRDAKGAHDASNKTIESKIGEINTPTVKSTDAASNSAVNSNSSGDVRLKIKVSTEQRPGEFFVQPVDEIQDGLLWEPALIAGKPAVRINKGHLYYSRVYTPNLVNGATVQGMDALLWGMTVAELNCVSDSTKRTFEEMRFQVSRNLRRLVEDLPEPKVEE